MDQTPRSPETSYTSIPFSFFVSLLSEISKIRPKARSARSLSSTYPALQVFQRWVAALRLKFGPDIRGETTVILFRLLFPEQDVRRKYDMQEPRLAQQLARALGVSTDTGGRGAALSEWKAGDSVGCLGHEVMEVMNASATDDDCSRTLTIHQVDSFLDQLASLSRFSHDSLRKKVKRTSGATLCARAMILRSLFSSISPLEASFLTQIILKDLRPILYPAVETHYTAALKQKSNVIIMLTVPDALKAWDPSCALLRRWKLVSGFEEALNYNEEYSIRVFIPSQIPKTVKGTSCAQALQLFRNVRRVWAETKYDGERAQIHVKINDSTDSADIKIFSKRKRDSTKDLIAIHPVIRDALGLPGSNPSPVRTGMVNIERDIIIEAELVAFSDVSGHVDEFWRIRSLIESTSKGPRRKPITRVNSSSQAESQHSLESDASNGGRRHLALVFFDILFLDSVDLTSTPYSSRRRLLESVILPIPGYSMLAERSPVDLRAGVDESQVQLRKIFARVLSYHQEGLVLKAEEGHYIKSPWVKLKKDYIPRIGDGLDFVIIGACWDKDRGRELRVPPSTYTTFFLGLMTNEVVKSADVSHLPDVTPHFEIFFTVSYGLSRDQLEDLNFMIKSADSFSYDEIQNDPGLLAYTYDFFSVLRNPDVMLRRDSLLLTEVFGAGFTKAPTSKYYELRFPRMSKVFRRSERSWMEGMFLKEFQLIAREAVGRERSGKEADDWCNWLWGKPSSPGPEHPTRRKQREDLLLADLERVDKELAMRTNESKRVVSPKQTAPGKKHSPRSSQYLATVTNLSSNEYRKERTRLDDDLLKGLEAVLDNDGSPPPPPPELPSPPASKPRRTLFDAAIVTSADKSMHLASVMLTPVPLAQTTLHSTTDNMAPSTDPQKLVVNELGILKRKRDVDDDCASYRKKTLLDCKQVTGVRDVKLQTELPICPTPAQGSIRLFRSDKKVTLVGSRGQRPERDSRNGIPVSALQPGSEIPWKIPPPPPPGASGWLPRRSDNVVHEPNNSDRLALYYGTSKFYTNLPRWEEVRDSKENDSDIMMQDPRRSPVRVAKEAQDCSVTFRVERSSMFEQQALLFTETPIGKLMATSIVWFARELDTPAPGYRPSWGQLIPQTNGVTRLDALLVGCGWHMLMDQKFKKNGVERGVVLIDFEEDGEVSARVNMANIVHKCQERWEKIAKWKETERLRPVWIVDARALRWEVLEGMKVDDGLDALEEFVLWKKV